MAKLDDMIEEALSAEDEALLARHGREPGYFVQARGLFRGPLAWVIWLTYVLQVLAFFACVYTFWRLFGAIDALAAIRWATGSVILLMFSLFGKNFMGIHMETNRVLREIKRLELRLVRLEERGERNGRSGDPA